MKVLGVLVMASGIILLAFGLAGLRLHLLWFLDAFGPTMAFLLKFGVIILGVWLWRNTERRAAVEKDIRDAQNHHDWMPITLAGALIIGAICFVTTSALKDARLRQQLTREPAPAEWASARTSVWPDLTLMQRQISCITHRWKSAAPALCACPPAKSAL